MKNNRIIMRWLLLAVLVATLSAASSAQIAVGVSVRVGPPALPVYAQPICPGPGYMWTPGYWAWNDANGYYWVPGTWVMAPVGMLWTPGWWGWGGGVYLWHAGYWGPHVGFYGGINYGFGYGGVGFVGGEWRGGGFFYNRSVTNVSVTNVTNVYNKTVVVNNTTVNNTSYNGGTGGIQTHPTPQEESYANEPHTAPLAAQTEHAQLASQNRENFASVNQGRPAVAATARAGDFSSHSAIPARSAGGEYHAPTMSPAEARVSSPANSNHGGSSEGFRSFTPPNANNRGEAASSGNSSSGNSSFGQNNNERNNGGSENSYHPQSQPKNNKPPKQHKSSPPRRAPKNSHPDRFR
jgi:hypothetical protein